MTDQELIAEARKLVQPKEVKGGIIKEVGCALITKNGKLFTGVSLHLASGIGFCAESSAIADMISHTDETEIEIIVAHNGKQIYPPCGRCRELMSLINGNNLANTDVIVAENKVVKLKELLPFD